MMQLIDSYLSEVERFLPADQRADILGELRSSLEEQVLDVAGDTTPGLDDQKVVINRLGHPLKVASGYQGQRYLIGPELFPTFVQTLKTVLVVVAAIQIAIMLTAYVSSGWTTSVRGLLSGIFESLLWASIIVSLVFASIEYSGDRLDWYDKWSADSLSLSVGPPVERGAVITNLISEGIFLAVVEQCTGAAKLDSRCPRHIHGDAVGYLDTVAPATEPAVRRVVPAACVRIDSWLVASVCAVRGDDTRCDRCFRGCVASDPSSVIERQWRRRP